MSNKIILELNGEETEIEVVKIWKMNNINYIAYTDGSKTNDILDLFVSKCIIENDKIKLDKINDNEWQQIDEYLNKNIN